MMMNNSALFKKKLTIFKDKSALFMKSVNEINPSARVDVCSCILDWPGLK